MTMSPRLRRSALALHLAVSVGWIGAVIGYLALGVAAVTTRDDLTVRAAWIAMEITGWFAIVPLAVASLVSGLVMALGTRWGVLRHYWVVISLVLTIAANVVLLAHMPDVSAAAAFARTAGAAKLRTLGGDLAHPSVGLVLLMVVQVLNVAKPRGLTRRGRRHQRQIARTELDARLR